jgi:hypothetical protein
LDVDSHPIDPFPKHHLRIYHSQNGQGTFVAFKKRFLIDVLAPMEIPTSSNTQSAPSSTSEGKKKKQKASAHEKNPQYPPKEYGHYVRKKVLEFYNIKTTGALERTYIDHRADGLMSLQVELNGIITKALEQSELYNNYDRDYWEHGRWLDQQIISSTSNIIHVFECVYKKG